MSRYPRVVRNRFPLAAAIALLAALAAAVLLTGPPSLVHAANEPVSLTLTASSGKITASWTAPDVGTGVINDYGYQYKKQSESNWSTEATTTATSVEITGLDNGVTYDVRVRTRYTPAGSNTAEYSAYVKTWTTPGTAPGAVTGVTLTSGDGKIIVTWGLTSAVPPVSSYGVRYRQKDSNTWVSLSDPTDVTMVGTALTTDETSHGSGGDPLDLGEITHATLTAREISFVNESVGTGSNAKSGVYRLSDGIRSMNFRAHTLKFSNEATVKVRYAATKPTASNLHTHGTELCTQDAALPNFTAVCSGNINDATGSIPTGGYLWAYTVDSETAVSRNWVIQNPKPAFDNRRAVITGVTNGTEYEVEVNATNPAGSSASWSDTSSTKAGGPDAPAAPTLTSGNAQISVSWTAPANNGSAITDYDVQYKAKTVNTWTSHTFTGTGTSTTISSSIANGTEYEVQVRATNGNGTGEWSPSATLKAGVPAAPAAPTLASGNAQLSVSWTAPADNGSTITDYDVQYSSDNGTTWTEWNASDTSTTTSATITTLTNGTSYQVQVRAGNTHGDGPWSPTATLKAGLPAAPAAPTLTSGNAQLAVSWTAPADNGSSITDYDVQYSSDGGTTWTEWNASNTSTTTSATITPLTNGTSYQVQVRAGNTHGDGPWSPSATLKAGLPAAPAAPTLTPGGTTLTVTWVAPSANGGTLSGFKVQYKQSSDATWTAHTFTSTGSTTSTSIGSLTNGTAYDVQVRATNEHGDGPWSPTASATPAQAPDAPAKPTISGGNFMLWTAPANNGAAITDYDVRYSLDSGSTWTEWDPTSTSTTTFLSLVALPGGQPFVLQVRAENSAGAGAWSPSSESVTLPKRAPDKPDPPRLAPGNQSLGVSWTPPESNGEPITDYAARHSLDGSNWTNVLTGASDTATSTTISGLTNGNTPYVQVRATNSIGDSAWSDSATQKVGVPAAPAAPTLTPGNAQLAVSWTAPADNGSGITDYDVQYSSDDGTTWTEWNAGNTGTSTSATITTLTNGTEYQVQVRAANTLGDGPWSPSATLKAGVPAAPAAPTLASGNAQLAVSWTAPANSGSAITDYDVQYSSDSGSTWTEWNAGNTSTTTSATVTTLTNGTSYQVQVRAGNTHGDGPWSPSATLTPGLPATPDKPTVEPGNRSLTVKWTAPADNGSPITDYDVEYRTFSQAKLGNWVHWNPSETSTSTTTTITGTDNGTDYQTRVKARNSAGDGGWSPHSDGVKSGAPATPAAPGLTPGSNKLAVTWAAPADNGSAINNYDVRYRTTGASAWTRLDFGLGITVTGTLPSNETSHGSAGDPIDTGQLTHADLTKLGLSFTRESVGTGANEKFGVYKLNDGMKEMKLGIVAGGVTGQVAVRYADTKPSADNLHTHGSLTCTAGSPTCGSDNAIGPLPRNSYFWAYTTASSTLTTAIWLFSDLDVAALDRALDITGLTTGTEYEAQVRASNAHGDGGWSPSAMARVGAPSAVRYLCAHPKNGALLVDWWEPATTNGAITDYDLRYREVGTTAWTEWQPSVTSTTRSATITGLTNGKDYEVQGRAENANGAGPWSASEIMRAGVPGAFTRPSIAPRFWDLTATWDTPTDTGGSAITDYDVQYLNSDELPEDSRGIPVIPKNANGNEVWDLLPWIDWQKDTVSTVRSTQITGLDPLTAYWTRARAVNSYGDGVWSGPGADRTYRPDQDRLCSRTGTTTLHLGWRCDIEAGVDGVGSFDSSSITTGTGLLKARESNGADQATFTAINHDGGSATVTTTKAGVTVDTFAISVPAFAIASATASDATPAAGDTFIVTVTLDSPLHHATRKNIHDSNRNPIAGKYARSWVTLEMPTGWTAVNPNEGTATAPVEVVSYLGKTVRFTVSVPADATAGAQTIKVKANTVDLRDDCVTNPNCLEGIKDEEIANLSVTVASSLVSMMVSGMAAAAPPAAVASVSASRSDGSIVASWPVAATSTKYHVTYTTDTGPNKSWTLAALEHPTNSITIAEADAAKPYIVGVRAGNAAGWSGWVNSDAVPAAVTTPPGSVSGLSASRSDGNIVASWDAVDGATKYHVTYTTDVGNNKNWQLAALEHPTNSITIANADDGLPYKVGVRAGNAAGWSGWVNSATVPPAATATPPAAVSGLSASRSGGNIVASWDAVDGATKYHVTYSTDGGSSWSLAADAHATNSITIANADDGLPYKVGVRAGNAAGWSGWVNSDTVPAAGTPPAAVSGLSASRSGGSIVANWDAVSGATKYHVTYTTDGGKSWSLAADAHATNSITISNASNNKAYIVGVRAGNAAGWSGWMNSNEVPMALTPPGSVGSVSATHNGDTVSVTWDAVGGATKYHVTYSTDGGGSWSLAALEHDTNSITIADADSAKTYVVGVRAGNAAGWSGWVNSAPASHSGGGT